MSIGVPTFNRVARLRQSLPHMLAQDYENIEVVISDNASTDETREYCEEMARKDARVRYHRQPRNIGAIANYGEVLRVATGEYYMHLADDDDLDHSYVSRCLSALLADPSLLVVCGRSDWYREGKFDHTGARTNILDDDPSSRLLGYYETIVENGAFHGVVRRSVIAALPRMRDDAMAGDWLFIAALAFTGRIKTLEETNIVKHWGGASATIEGTASTFGQGPRAARYWVETIMLTVFRDIAWESPVYAPLGPVRRMALAARAVAVLARRHRGRWVSRRFMRALVADALPVEVKRRLVALRDAARS